MSRALLTFLYVVGVCTVVLVVWVGGRLLVLDPLRGRFGYAVGVDHGRRG